MCAAGGTICQSRYGALWLCPLLSLRCHSLFSCCYHSVTVLSLCHCALALCKCYDCARSLLVVLTSLRCSEATRIGNWQLSYTPAAELDKLLSIQRHGMLGTDIATTIPLPSPNGTKRTLWLLGDTPWGSYDEKSCARQAKVMPRNVLAVTTDQETCFHLRQVCECCLVRCLTAHTDFCTFRMHTLAAHIH